MVEQTSCHDLFRKTLVAINNNNGILCRTYVSFVCILLMNQSNAALLQVRRGVDRADIYSIALSPNVQWLAVSSDKGTVHIFSLRVRVIGEDAYSTEHETSSNSLQPLVSPASGANPGSSLSFLRGKTEIRRYLKK